MLLAAATATRIRPTELRHSLDKTALVR
jgi:hypothetical protein